MEPPVTNLKPRPEPPRSGEIETDPLHGKPADLDGAIAGRAARCQRPIEIAAKLYGKDDSVRDDGALDPPLPGNVDMRGRLVRIAARRHRHMRFGMLGPGSAEAEGIARCVDPQ